MFAINILLAGWIGWLASELISDELAIKNSLISISWFLTYPILDLLEEKGINLLQKYLWKKQ